jgi:hypothetical protein
MGGIESNARANPLMKPSQFSIVRVLLAVAWFGLALAVWRATSPFNWHGFLDDDPDNIWPRIGLAAYILPLAGAFGSLRGQTLSLVTKAILLWLGLSAVLFAIGIARLF